MIPPRSIVVLGPVLSGLLLVSTAAAREQDEDASARTDESAAEGSEDEPSPRDADEQEPSAGDESAEGEEAGKAEVAAGAAAGGEAAAAGDTKGVAAEDGGGDGGEQVEDGESIVDITGYLAPGFGLRYRPDALPIDQLEHGFFGTAGLIVEAEPVEMWTATIHLLFSTAALQAVTGVEVFDYGGDGSIDGVALSWEKLPGVAIEEVTVAFDPIQYFGAKAGAMRIPFTLQQQSANTALLFPARSGPNEVFLSGADPGALLYSNVGDGHFTPSFGVFNGDSLGLTLQNMEARGVVLALRADVNPFGAFPFDEGDVKRGDFRLGAGFGLLYRPATLYDQRTGYEFTSMQDLRLAASLRMAVAGLYVGAEYLRRQQTDDFTSRPHVADGAYAQLSYFWQIVDPVAIEPIARVGFVAKDQTFDPRLIGWIDAGLSFYPAADAKRPQAVRLTLQYLGERRFTEQEEAHGGAVSARLIF